MSAVVVTRTVPVPRGASALERSSIRIADAVTRWATARAERRQERHEAMLAEIQRQQTAKADPHEVEWMLAGMGMRGR